MKRREDFGDIRDRIDDDDNDETGDPGPFQKASAEEMATRKIVKSRRSMKPAAPSDSATPSSSAGFSFPSSSASVQPTGAGSSNPFKNINLAAPSTSAPTPTSVFSGFSFPSSSASTSVSETPNPFKNINLPAPATTTLTFSPTSTVGPSSSGVEKASAPIATSKTSNSSKATDDSTKTITTTNTSGNSEEYAKRTKKLNKSFLTWAEHQIEENAVAVWKDAVQDYINYQNKIKEKYPTASSESVATNTTACAPKEAVTNNAPKREEVTFAAKSAPVPSTNGSDNTNSNATKQPFTFNSTPPITFGSAPTATATATTTATTDSKPAFAFPTTNTFSFNAPTTSASNSSSTDTSAAAEKPFSFTFGNNGNSSLSSTAPNPFSFSGNLGSSNTSSASGFGGFGGFSGFGSAPSSGGASGSAGIGSSATGGAGDEEGGEGGDDEEGMPMLEPEKILRNEQDTDEILVEVPSKLKVFDKEDNEWKEIGKGTFRITKDIATQKKRILVRNTMGKITLNANFYPGMKFDLVKGALRFSAVVAKMEKGKPTGETEFRMYLVKLSKEEINKVKQMLDDIVASLPSK